MVTNVFEWDLVRRGGGGGGRGIMSCVKHAHIFVMSLHRQHSFLWCILPCSLARRRLSALCRLARRFAH